MLHAHQGHHCWPLPIRNGESCNSLALHMLQCSPHPHHSALPPPPLGNKITSGWLLQYGAQAQLYMGESWLLNIFSLSPSDDKSHHQPRRAPEGVLVVEPQMKNACEWSTERSTCRHEQNAERREGKVDRGTEHRGGAAQARKKRRWVGGRLSTRNMQARTSRAATATVGAQGRISTLKNVPCRSPC